MSTESSATLESEVSQWVVTSDTVFPHHANHLGSVFGGHVLAMMDINASIACRRFCGLPVVTASTEPVDFRNPIFVGEVMTVRSKVAWAGRTSMITLSEVHAENPETGETRLCTVGHFNFVALKDGKPAQVPALRLESAVDRKQNLEASHVRQNILARMQRHKDMM